VRGYEAAIVTLRHQRDWPRRETIEGVPVVRVAGGVVGNREQLPGPLRKLAYLLGVSAVGWTLWRHRRRYDVLCVYQLGLLSLPAAVACLLARKPIVILLRSAGSGRGASERRQPSRPPLFPEADVLKTSTEARNREISDVDALQSMPPPIRRCTLYLLRHTRGVLVVLSSRMKNEMAASGIQLPVLYIPNGVDLGRFSPLCGDSRDDERAQTAVCVTRLAYPKGVDTLLRAWQLVHEQAPGARLIIVGRGALRDHLERLAEDLGIAPSVEFSGLQHDVPAQLHRGAVAVLASRWEGMPNAVLEAMACGLPCVATRVSGTEDIIQPGVTGLLVEPEDYPGLAASLLTLLQNPALAQEYGRAARAAVEQSYSHERVTDAYAALYQQLANGMSITAN
jgi:Glycosyl transferases group 1